VCCSYDTNVKNLAQCLAKKRGLGGRFCWLRCKELTGQRAKAVSQETGMVGHWCSSGPSESYYRSQLCKWVSHAPRWLWPPLTRKVFHNAPSLCHRLDTRIPNAGSAILETHTSWSPRPPGDDSITPRLLFPYQCVTLYLVSKLFSMCHLFPWAISFLQWNLASQAALRTKLIVKPYSYHLYCNEINLFNISKRKSSIMTRDCSILCYTILQFLQILIFPLARIAINIACCAILIYELQITFWCH
jgi:hypothetical protein